MASNDLTTIGFVQSYMQDTSTATAAVLPQMITAISQYFETQCSQSFINADYTKSFNGSGNHRQILWPQPINSISSVSIFGNTVNPAVGSTGSGYVYDKYGLWMRCSTFPKGIANVSVTWNSGYASSAAALPYDLQQAVADVCNVKLKRMPQADKMSLAAGQASTTFVVSDLTPFAASVLKSYKPGLIAQGIP